MAQEKGPISYSESPSQLAHIREALRGNPDVAVIDESKRLSFPFSDNRVDVGADDIAQTIRLVVAPAYSLFNPEMLNNFMRTLVPGISAVEVYEASEEDGDLYFGELHFNEIVGTSRVEIADEELKQDVVIGSESSDVFTGNLLRATSVKVYPHALYAETVTHRFYGRDSWNLGHMFSYINPVQIEVLQKLKDRDPGEIATLLKEAAGFSNYNLRSGWKQKELEAFREKTFASSR